jgi:hypothetical protein
MSYSQEQLQRDLNPLNARRPVLYIGDGNWGTHAWNFLFNIVLSYEGDTDNLQEFLSQLQFVLPCESCKDHYLRYIKQKQIPHTLPDIFLWLTNLEQTIAKNLNKKAPNRLKQIRKESSNRHMHLSPEQTIVPITTSSPVSVIVPPPRNRKEARQRKKDEERRKRIQRRRDEKARKNTDPRYCPNCSKTRAELGVTTASMGLGGRGGNNTYATQIGTFGYGR